MPDGGDQSDAKASSVTDGFAVFQIKNPSRSDDKFTLRIRLDATVDELRALISQTYEGRPPPSQQTLVYAGRVLNQSDARIKDFLRPHPEASDPAVPYSLHLVVRSPAPPAPAPAPTPSPAPAPAPAAAPPTAPSTSFPHQPSPSRPGQSHALPGPSTAAGGPSTSQPPPPPPSAAPTASTSQPQQGPDSHQSAAPYFLVMNPVMAAAYQAAYTAALAAAANLQPESSNPAGAQAGLPGLQMPPIMPPFALYPNPQAGTPGNAMLNQFVTFPAIPTPYNMYPMGLHQHMHYGPMPQPAGPFQQDEGLAQRAQPGRGHTIVLHAQRVRGDRVVNRMRVFRFRLNLRVLLQLLVFVVLFYQHFTMSRFLVLMTAALVWWVTSSWTPLRRLITALLHPRPHIVIPPGAHPAGAPPAAAQPRAAADPQQQGAAAPQAADAAAGPQPEQPQAQGAAGPEQAGAAGAGVVPQQRPPGILREVALLLVGFVTSLVPGWHFNPEDAAAVAAAQQALAAQDAEDDEAQQQDLQHPHQD